MKRLWLLGLLLGALGLSGCAADIGDPGPEPTIEKPNQLDVQAPKGTTGGQNDPGDPGDPQNGDLGDIHPRNLATGADPTGPSPYPWNGSYEEDPNGGPSPYPWTHQATSGGPGTNTGTDGNGDTTATPTNGK